MLIILIVIRKNLSEIKSAYFFQSLRKNKEILNTQLSEVVNLLEQKAGKMTFYQDFWWNCGCFIN